MDKISNKLIRDAFGKNLSDAQIDKYGQLIFTPEILNKISTIIEEQINNIHEFTDSIEDLIDSILELELESYAFSNSIPVHMKRFIIDYDSDKSKILSYLLNGETEGLTINDFTFNAKLFQIGAAIYGTKELDLEIAVRYDRDDVLEYIMKHKLLDMEDFIDQICIYGIKNFEEAYSVFEWAEIKLVNFYEKLLEKAILYNSKDVIDWILAEGYLPNFDKTSRLAVINNKLEILQKLYTFYPQPLSPDLANEAAVRGFTEMLDWLILNNCPLSVDVYVSAIYGGNFELVKYLFNKYGFIPDSSAVFSAATFSGNTDFLEWLYNNNYFAWDSSVYDWAAYGSKLNVIEWAYEKGLPWSKEACTWAADVGCKNIILWAMKKGLPMDNELRKKYITLFN